MRRGRGLLERLLARHREVAGDGVSDGELLRRFSRERDEAAFELLVWRHGLMVLGLCRRAIRDEQLSEDAFQAVFLVLARKAGSVRGNLGGWLFKVARRVAVRASARHRDAQPVIETAAECGSNTVERQELTDLLDAEVARLPERLRKPVVLCYLGGQSTEDAARELGCPRGTILSRLATARKRLVERLTRRGVTLPTTLTVAGTGLTAGVVSATVTAAHRFRVGALLPSPAINLADGVLQTMARGTLLTALGSTALAFTLVSSVGWVMAQQGAQPAPGNNDPQAVAAAPPDADLPKGALKPAEPERAAEDKQLDERQMKLELLAATLKAEIELQEKQLELLAETTDKIASQLAQLHKLLADVEAEYQRVSREIAKMDAEIAVLKKRLDAMPQGEPDPAVIQLLVTQDARVVSALQSVKRAQAELNKTVQISPGDKATIKALKDEVVKSEQAYTTAQKRATEEALDAARSAENKAIRERITKITLEIEIQKEIRDTLRTERDSLTKLVAERAGSGLKREKMQQAITPNREALAKIQAELLTLRLQRTGVSPPQANTVDAKLDMLLREVNELRKEVRELKKQK